MAEEEYLKKNDNDINISNKKTIHFGFSILKNLLSFNVIISHCFNINSTKNKTIHYLIKRRGIHVPSFMIISFYFNHNTLISFDTKKKIYRFERLFIPYLGWPIIIFIICNITKNFNRYKNLCSFKILIIQLILGSGNGILHFWFLFDLIFTTIIFQIFILLFRKNYLFILNLLLLFSYFIQYSKYSTILYLYTYKFTSLARENNMIPFAVTGFTLSSLKVLRKLEKYKFNSFIFSLITYYLIHSYNIFSKSSGAVYNGLKLNVSSVCEIIIFSLFSLNNIRNNKLKTFLLHATNYSGGIFYLHQAIQFFFKNIIYDIKKGSLLGILIIYFITYLICFFGNFIFKNYKVKYLFS